VVFTFRQYNFSFRLFLQKQAKLRLALSPVLRGLMDLRNRANCNTSITKGPVIRATFSCNLSRNNVAVASCDCLLRVLPPSRATDFYVAESKSDIYFLQHENLLREKVVIRATNNLNLQRQHCCATSCTKMLPVLLGLNTSFRPKYPSCKNNKNCLNTFKLSYFYYMRRLV